MKQRFYPRKIGRGWEVWDEGRFSYPGNVPGFGSVPVSKTEEECERLATDLEGFCLENPKVWPRMRG